MATRNVNETSSSKQPSRQGIGNPSISNVRWDDQNILVDWSAAKGATKHTLQLINEENQVIKVVELLKLPTEKLNKIIPLTYGQTIEFVIGATKGEEHQESRKKFLIGGDESVTNVVAEKYRIPSREIIVQWKQPATPPHSYKLNLYEVKKDKIGKLPEEENLLEKNQLSHRFVELKSSTTYICEVIPIYDGEPKVGSFSNQEVTDQSVQTAGFNIKERGKPIIETCSYLFNNSYLESQFAWKLPDLGVEKNNFKLLGVQAWIIDKTGKGNKHVAVKIINNKALPITLDVLKNYTFIIHSTYLDIDENKQFTAENTECFKTGIGSPSILNAKCEGQHILVDWSAAKGATKHSLKLINQENDEIKVKLGKGPREKLTEMIQFTYGRTIEFIIEATRDEETRTEKKCFLIGGDKSVTKVVAKKGRCPWREILVTWEQPTTRPHGYELNIYEWKKDSKHKFVSKENLLEQTQLSHRFVELKSSTIYICEVIPIYKDGPKVGSFSNPAVTSERIQSTIENHADFGKPDRIMNKEKGDCNTDLIIELFWSQFNLGENYKITGYHVIVFQSGIFTNTEYFNAKLPRITTVVDVAELQRGLKYDVKFTTEYIDLDDCTQKKKMTKTHSFCTSPSKPIITNCELEKGVIKISWKSVPGADSYRLVIKDEHFEKNMVKDEVISGKNNTVKIQTTEQLSIGRKCMIKVMAFANKLNSESEWKAYLIGGKLVPRNVEASRYSDNPKRSILVTFATPEQGPAKEYKVTTLPEFGKRKTFLCSSTTFLVEYLRKGIKYKFHVFAKHGEEWSDGSISNPQKTDGDDNHNPAVGFAGSTGSQFDLQGAHFTGNATTVNFKKGKEFGKVRDLKLVQVREKQPNKKEILKLSWKVPSFDNNVFDYKVEKYKVEIRKINSPDPRDFYLEFVKDLNEYNTDNQKLELGETYNISVSTIYIDIDQDEEYISNAAEKEVQTRPCQPTGVKCNATTNASNQDCLRIEWNAAKGATYYTVDIHKDEYEQHDPLFKRKVEKGTEWERTLDNLFGYGTSYHAVITAIGNENKYNSKRTDQQTIGGDFAPNKVIATIDHDKVVDRNTEVYLSWEPPAKQAESYVVTFENEGKQILSCTESELLITGLKAGAYYTFKVSAIDKQSKKKSGGCVSNSIQTNPTPTMVKNVQTFPGDNPSTSINISWDNEEESTKYRVNVISFDKKMSKDMNTTDNWIAVDGLLPDTNYSIRVAGGNSKGFGKDSIVTNFKTELGIPKNIYLLNNPTSPDTSLILQFSLAEGEPVNYLGAFNKCENQAQHEDLVFIDVQPGHTFNDLEPNTRYYVMVLGVFENEKKGKAGKSEALMTAPSKPVIDKSGCCTDNKINSSNVFFLKWKSDRGCKEHEIIIKRGDKVENQQIIQNKTELRYSCMHEASQYTAQIRTKNITFGQWSDEAVIDLAPVKLKNIKAELDQESNNILIQCKKEAKHSLSYFCQALCNDESSEEPVLVPTHHDDENIVKFTFKPPMYAEKYSFKMWAVDGKGQVGESSLSPYVISRPAKAQITKVERDDKNPSTDIDIIWEALERCDEYEIQIKTRGEQKFETCARLIDTSFNYRCKNPGRFYVVCVRGIRESVRGNLSDKVTIGLGPSQVELIEDRDAQEPVESVQVKWKELETKPEGYRVILYNERKEQIANDETELMHHVFEKLTAKPGSLCYCTVAAYNTIGEGKSTKSQNYRIQWKIPDGLFIHSDETDPSRRARISWDGPDGVNCFRLEIENNHSGTVITLDLEKSSYIFNSGIPGNSYTIRLYSGCDGRYDVKSVGSAMTMKPEGPSNITAVANNFVKGIIVTFKDNSAQQKSFEIFAKRLTEQGEKNDIRNSTTTQERAVFKNLLPGASYEISVVSSINDNKSKKIILDGYIQTFPDNINNLRSKVENGFILFQWDPLEVTPDEYIVRLRVNNEYCSEESTQETEFKKHLLKGVHSYELEIAAANTAGKGKTARLEKIVEVPDIINNLQSKIENGFILFEWDPLEIPPDEYIVRLRVNNEYCSEESTKETEFKKHLLKGVHLYELEIAASNTAGKGKTARLEKIVKVPDNINNLQSKVENGFISFKWDPLEIPPDEYIVRLRVNNECCFDKTTKETEFKKQLLKGVHSYELEIAASNTAGKGKTTQLEKIVKVPEDIQNLRSKIENGAIIYEWDPVGKMLDEYTIQWRVNNEFITEEKTKETKFEIRFLKPAQSYSLRVMGSNIVENGNMSQWNTFITNPLPPRNIKVTNNKKSPRTSCIVKFEDELNTLKKYKVSAFIEDENGDDLVKRSVTTEKFVAFVNDLDEATDYYFKVQTIFCGKKSEEIMFINDY